MLSNWPYVPEKLNENRDSTQTKFDKNDTPESLYSLYGLTIQKVNNMFKIVPNAWDVNKSYLIAKKSEASTSKGRTFTFYEVVNRRSFITSTGGWEESESLKGVTFTKNELSQIIEL